MTMHAGGESDDPWYQRVSVDNIRELDPRSKFAFRGVLDRQLWRPIEVREPKLKGPNLLAIGKNDKLQELPIMYIPHIRPLLHYPTPHLPNIPLVTREQLPAHFSSYLQVLALPPEDAGDIPAAHFVFGEHPNHPGQPGFHIAAVLIGTMSLIGSRIDFVEPDKWQLQFFPIAHEVEKQR